MFESIRSLLIPRHQSKEATEKAIEFIKTSKERLAHLSRNERTHTVRQLQFLKENKQKLFEAFAIVAANSPLNAIKELLKLEQVITPEALPFFWAEASVPIDKLLKTSSGEVKKSIYMEIIKSAHKGYISDFIINHASDIGIMISSPKVIGDMGFLDTFVAHAAPKTEEFMETFKPQFLDVYTTKPYSRYGLTRKFLKACNLSHGTLKPPAYIENMRLEQIRNLATQIDDLYHNGDKGFKAIASCLHDLTDLKACTTPMLSKVESDRNDGCSSFYYLFKLKAEGRRPLYILAHKQKARGVPDEGGKLSIALVHPDIEIISIAFPASNNDKASQATVKKLVKEYTPTYSADDTITHQALPPSFELTADDKEVDLSDVHSPPQDRDILSLQHDRSPEIH